MRLIYVVNRKKARLRVLVQREGRNFALRNLRQSEHCYLRRFLKLHKFLHRFIWRKRHSNNCKLLVFFFWRTAAVVGKHLTKGLGGGEGGPPSVKADTHLFLANIFLFCSLAISFLLVVVLVTVSPALEHSPPLPPPPPHLLSLRRRPRYLGDEKS